MIIYTNYQCQEMGNPDYDYSDEIYDIYEIDLSSVKDLLHFDLNVLYSYAIYATYFVENKDKYYRIYNYLKDCPSIKLKELDNIGIEKLPDLDVFYKNFANYLATNSDNYVVDVLKNIINLGYVDEYEICTKSIKAHPELFFEYIKKLYEKHNYNEIIILIPKFLSKMEKSIYRNDLCYIMIDSIKLSKKNIDINKYLYEAFLTINNLPNFLVILYHNLYDEKIKKIVDSIEYKDDYYELFNEICIEDKRIFDFVLGDFEKTYEKYKNNNEEIMYLMMLYLSNNLLNQTKIKNRIVCSLTLRFKEFHYKNLDVNIENKEKELLILFNKWKNCNPINHYLKEKFINMFKKEIEKEAEYILKNKIRSSYSLIVRKIVMFDEVLSSNNIIIKGSYIEEYVKKYTKYNAFRKEIKELLD